MSRSRQHQTGISGRLCVPFMQTLREMNDQIMGPTGSIPFVIISAPIPELEDFVRNLNLKKIEFKK